MEFKKKKVGLVTLGICLIVIGVISIVNQYSHKLLLKDYYLLFPVFLIILGLEFILTKLYHDAKNINIQLSPSITAVFLIIIVLVASFSWDILHRISFDADFPWRDINLSTMKLPIEAYNYKYGITQDYNSGSVELYDTQVIIINNIRGVVDVQPAHDDNLEVEAKIIAKTNDMEQGNILLKDIIKINPGVNTVINVEDPSQKGTLALQDVKLIIQIPAALAVEVNTKFGQVSVKEMQNDVSVDQKHDKVILENIGGMVVVRNEFGSTEIKNISKDADIKNRHGMIKVENIGGELSISNEFADSYIQNAKGNVNIISRHGRVDTQDISGNVIISNEYQNVYCNDIEGNVIITNGHGNISMENVKGNISGDNRYGNIILTNPSYINAKLLLSTSYGKIDTAHLSDVLLESNHNTQKAKASYGNASQNIELKTTHDNITIR